MYQIMSFFGSEAFCDFFPSCAKLRGRYLGPVQGGSPPCAASPSPCIFFYGSHQTCQPEWVCERSLLCYFSAFPSPCPLAGNKVPFHDPRLPELQKDYVAESQAGAGGGWWRWWRQEAGRVKDQATRQVIVLDHSSPRHGALEAKPSN